MTNHIGSESQDLATRLQTSGITVLSGTMPTLQAIKHVFDYQQFLNQEQKKAPVSVENTHKSKWITRLQQDKPFDEFESLSLLRDYQIPVQNAAIINEVNDAIIVAGKIGYPVVLKTAMPEILHKSDMGGVKLHLENDRDVKNAYLDLKKRLGARVLIASMETEGVEVAFGYIKDPQFGPLVLIASGGVFIEIFKDRQIALAPFGEESALKMINQLKINPLLDGARGTEICDKQALASALANFSKLAYDLRDFIEEMDVNPIKVHKNGCVAVDAMIVHQSDN